MDIDHDDYIYSVHCSLKQGLFLTNEGQLHNSNHIIMSSLVNDHMTIGNYVGVIGTKRVDKWFHKKVILMQYFYFFLFLYNDCKKQNT